MCIPQSSSVKIFRVHVSVTEVVVVTFLRMAKKLLQLGIL